MQGHNRKWRIAGVVPLSRPSINGEFLVVFTAEHVQLLPGVRVRLHDGGVQGRGWQRDQT